MCFLKKKICYYGKKVNKYIFKNHLFESHNGGSLSRFKIKMEFWKTNVWAQDYKYHCKKWPTKDL